MSDQRSHATSMNDSERAKLADKLAAIKPDWLPEIGAVVAYTFTPVELDTTIRALRAVASALSEKQPQRAFEEQPFAWAVKLASGVESLVYHPIEGALELQEGDVAYPLFREVYTQAQLDAADAEAKRITEGLRIE